jgi:hypothetical protein
MKFTRETTLNGGSRGNGSRGSNAKRYSILLCPGSLLLHDVEEKKDSHSQFKCEHSALE